MQKQKAEHIMHLHVVEGGSYELPSIHRNLNRFLDLFLCGEKLRAGCKAVFLYADDLENPFYEQTFSEVIHTNNDDWIVSVSRWNLRREGYRGEFSILIMIYDTDSSEFARLTIPIKGKRAVCKRNRV